MDHIFELKILRELQSSGKFQASDASLIKKLVTDVTSYPTAWQSLANLNSSNVDTWDWILYRAIGLDNVGWDAKFSQVVAFTKVVSQGWKRTIPQYLDRLAKFDIGIDDYFKLERTITYKLSSLLGDLNSLHARVCPHRGFDISPAVFRMSHAFLPPVVYQLEELGLPRMLTRKIHDAGISNFENPELTLVNAIIVLRSAQRRIAMNVFKNTFERYAFDFFLEGVTVVSKTDQLKDDRSID
jgi:hypothetical protein